MNLFFKGCSIFVFMLILVTASHSMVLATEKEPNEKYYFDKHYRIDENEGFSLDEKEKIEEDDPHYGWSLGSLYVSGFSQRTKDDKGNPVFLKKAGDQVVLGFELQQKINKLNGNEDLSIANDDKAYDEYFEIPKTSFGKGALIIRHTDYQNKKGKPNLYINYLSSKSKVNANTTVELNEEGDYEVALDYVIKDAPRKIFGLEILPSYYDYTVRLFKFSVRNGNSMVFPFDVKTGEELSNKAFTENGFRIDLAKSHYLKVFVKRDIIIGEGTNDTRENKPAKDGDVYTEEGVYTITVEDPSTEQVTTKKIYVGKEDRYKAYVTTGLSLEEIDEELANGAEVGSDGNLIYTLKKDSNSGSENQINHEANNQEEEHKSKTSIFPLFIGIIILLGIVFFISHRKKNISKKDGGK